MKDLDIYIIKENIDRDIELLDSIDEGKIRDGIKKIWHWITGKNKKNKKPSNTSNTSVNIDNSNNNTNIKSGDIDKYLSLKKMDLDTLKDKIYDLNNIGNQFEKVKSFSNSNKYSYLWMSYQNEFVGIVIFINPDRNHRPNDEYKYEKYIHIIDILINKGFVNSSSSIMDNILDKIIKYLNTYYVYNSNTCRGITIYSNEYKKYKNNFENIKYQFTKEEINSKKTLYFYDN